VENGAAGEGYQLSAAGREACPRYRDLRRATA